MRYSALQKKLVVNVQNGEVIGKICDLDILLKNLCIESIIVNQPKSFFQRLRCIIFQDVKIVIPIENIVHIGKDIITVKIR